MSSDFAGHRLDVVIDERTIREAIERLAREIVHDMPPNISVLVIGVLEGAKPFVTDLVRDLRGIGVCSRSYYRTRLDESFELPRWTRIERNR